jgi:signal recognition particle subunit SRP54
MIPGLGGAKQLRQIREGFDEKEISRLEAIIKSMTPGERSNPSIINGSRRRRIARGSGTSVQDVNRLLNQFEQTRKLFKQLGAAPGGRSGSGRQAGKAGRKVRLKFPS